MMEADTGPDLIVKGVGLLLLSGALALIGHYTGIFFAYLIMIGAAPVGLFFLMVGLFRVVARGD